MDGEFIVLSPSRNTGKVSDGQLGHGVSRSHNTQRVPERVFLLPRIYSWLSREQLSAKL